jgi:membrane protease YdiL (CAAX protease family)
MEMEIAADRPPPLGYLSTFGWAVLSGIASTIASIILLVAMYGDRIVGLGDLTGDGKVFSLVLIISTVAQVGVLALAIRRTGWPVAEYLGLCAPGTREAAIAFVVFAAYVLGSDALTYLMGRDIVTPFQADIFRTARDTGTIWLMWVAVVLVGPAGEEIMFRGFLYRGWARSPRLVAPAIFVISALWSILHIQYDWYGILQIFVGGLLLGWVRWRSGSTLLTFVLHGAMNAWATIETTLALG